MIHLLNSHFCCIFQDILDKKRQKKLFLDPFGNNERTLTLTMGSRSYDNVLFFDVQKLRQVSMIFLLNKKSVYSF